MTTTEYDLVLKNSNNFLQKIATIDGPLPRIGEFIHYERYSELKVYNIVYHAAKSGRGLERTRVANIEVLVKNNFD